MAKPYSEDLRDRLVLAVLGGRSRARRRAALTSVRVASSSVCSSLRRQAIVCRASSAAISGTRWLSMRIRFGRWSRRSPI